MSTGLTIREAEIVALVKQGLSRQEIANQVRKTDKTPISKKTVGFHLGHIFPKLGVHSLTELFGQNREPVSDQSLAMSACYLTPAEANVLVLLTRGLSNKKIAPYLGHLHNRKSVTRRTVEFHIGNIREKLGLKNTGRGRMALVRLAKIIVKQRNLTLKPKPESKRR